jgi:tetratricopeptide (TPR) repeat protein
LAWGEELIEPARAVDHPRLANLYLNVSQCYWTGRFEEAVTYADAAWGLFRSGRYEVAIIEGTLGSTYLSVGQPERAVEWCRAQTERGPDTHTLVRSMLVIALTMAGKSEEAKAAATGIIEAAEATHNRGHLPTRSTPLAMFSPSPPTALDALRRGLVIAHDSGSRLTESLIATMLARLETEHGDPLAALDYITSAVANFHDSGNIAYIQFALAILAVFFDRLGHLQPAATIAGYALNVFTTTASFQLSTVIDHLRNVLGEETYESLAHKGRTMTASDIVAYAYDQIEQARAALTAVAE